MGLNRLLLVRTVLVTAMMSVVGLAAGDVFDRTDWWLLAAPVLTGTICLMVGGSQWPLRLIGAVIGVAVSTSLVVVASGGGVSDIAGAFSAGPQRLLSTDWPSPDQPDLVGTIGALLALATVAATSLAQRRRLHLAPLLPVVVVHVSVIALSSPLGVRLHWLLALGLLAVVLAALRPGHGIDLRERLTLLGGERRLLPISVLAIGLATLLAVPLALNGRADPRRNEDPDRSAALLDPIEATLALQTIDPPIDLHQIRVESGAEPLRWRTAALADYDGVRWEPDLTLRPIGRRLGQSGGDSVSATVTFLAGDLQLVPLPGEPLTVDASIETDAERTLVRLTDRPVPGDAVRVVAAAEPSPSNVDPGAIGILEIDEDTLGLRDLAMALVDEGGAEPTEDLLTQLRSVESTMRNDFELRSEAQGGGLQRALIDRFLRDTQVGNAEQFSTAFVLLARALGVDARVATGFQIGDDRFRPDDSSSTVVLSSADAAVWPEVRVGDEWIAFDPVPPAESSDTTPPQPEPQVQTPAAPQPPIDPPPESVDDPLVTETDDGADVRAGLPIVVTWLVRGAAVVGAILAPLLIAVALVLGVKWRRRRRRLRGDPIDRIRGAWSVATNRLVDAGMSIAASDTNDKIAHDGADYVDTAAREILRLSKLANATTFGAPARPDLLAEDARFCLERVETSMIEARTLRQRIRWELSLRSLRRRTGSPV